MTTSKRVVVEKFTSDPCNREPWGVFIDGGKVMQFQTRAMADRAARAQRAYLRKQERPAR